jgi:hypothetical protein
LPSLPLEIKTGSRVVSVGPMIVTKSFFSFDRMLTLYQSFSVSA